MRRGKIENQFKRDDVTLGAVKDIRQESMYAASQPGNSMTSEKRVSLLANIGDQPGRHPINFWRLRRTRRRSTGSHFTCISKHVCEANGNANYFPTSPILAKCRIYQQGLVFCGDI